MVDKSARKVRIALFKSEHPVLIWMLYMTAILAVMFLVTITCNFIEGIQIVQTN